MYSKDTPWMLQNVTNRCLLQQQQFQCLHRLLHTRPEGRTASRTLASCSSWCSSLQGDNTGGMWQHE
jgi:hypothetical protein